jgi:Ser/Thr protein kinase RdoA (MazF antagonist)
MTTADALRALRRETGLSFTEVAPLAGGQVSHATVISDGGTRRVLKWWEPQGGESDSLGWLRRGAGRVEVLRNRGYPAPGYELIAERDGILLVVQELLPGRPPERLVPELVAQLVALNGLQGATQPGAPEWGSYLVGTLLHGADGYCLHDPMRTHSGAAAALLDRIVAIGEATPASSLPSADMAHLDFHHLNVLVDGGTVTGVVDCEGVRPGDRVFDLVTLLFCSVEGELERRAQVELWELVCGLRDAAALRAYVAHMALRLASWSIVHHDAATADRWITHGGRWLDRAG